MENNDFIIHHGTIFIWVVMTAAKLLLHSNITGVRSDCSAPTCGDEEQIFSLYIGVCLCVCVCVCVSRETASGTFCEHTLRFELHVHGFPLDPVRGLFFMQVSDIQSYTYKHFTLHKGLCLHLSALLICGKAISFFSKSSVTVIESLTDKTL